MVLEPDLMRIEPQRGCRGLARNIERCGLRQFRQGEFGEPRLAALGHGTANRPDILLQHKDSRPDFVTNGDRDGPADGRMTGKRHLVVRRENADAGGMAGLLRRQHEDRLRQVEFVGNAQHSRIVQVLRVEYDAERIAGQHLVGENIENLIAS